MAAPTYRAAGSGSGAAGSTFTTVAVPPGTLAGDVLYACITNGGAAAEPTGVPAGWTLTIGSVIGTGWAGIYEHQAGASEPASYTWSGCVDSCAGSMVGASGADATTPTHTVAATPVVDSSTPTGAGITTTVPECLVIGAIGIGDNTGVNTWAATDPATLTERVEVLSTMGNDTTSAMATAPQSAAGPTGNLTCTLAGSRNSVVFLIAVQPPQDAEPTPINATLDASLPALTGAAAVEQRTPVQLAAQLPALTASVTTGTPPVTAALTAQLPALGATIAVEQRTTIVLGAALPSLSAAVEAAGKAGAAVAGTLPRLTATATVQQTNLGAVEASLPALAAAITADQVEPGAGHLTARLPALTAAIAARTITPATIASTLPGLTAAAETRTMLPATVTTTLPPLTAAIRAGEPTISGAIDAALPRLTAAVTSRTLTRATIAAGLPALVARVTQTPDTVPVDVTIGAPRVGWSTGTPGVPAWSIGAPSVRRWP